jgi:ADP-heptose:LPS heptosyltransferase
VDRVAARGRVPLIDALRLAGAAPRVGVLRARPLGGLLVAVPALRALRAALPDARVTWVGLEPTRTMAARLPHLVDDFLALPNEAAAPGGPHGAAALPRFLERARAGRFDLALQWHSPDAAVDAWAAQLGARAVGGCRARAGAAPPAHGGRSHCWPDDGAVADALLASVARLGCPAHGRQLEFPLGEDDARDLHRAWPAHAVCPSWVCLHPGSRPPAPRWSPAGATAVGRALQATGHTLVLTGGADERRTVTRSCATSRRCRSISSAGRRSAPPARCSPVRARS